MNTPSFAQLAGKVREFYNAMPFNFADEADQAAVLIGKMNAIMAYPNLDLLLKSLPSSAKIIDIGSGTGWFVNSVAVHYGLNCSGIDQCQGAVERARATAERLGVAEKARFESGDLFQIAGEGEFTLVNSIGVLHHTPDCQKALESIAPLVRVGGYIHIALYHKYGREPFLAYFEEERREWFHDSGRDKNEVEQKALNKYQELNPHIKDTTFLKSWCRDQVFHPHETLHTLEETYHWLRELGFAPQSTSINNFKRVGSWIDLFELEKEKEAISYRSNFIEKKYFPGFFTILAEKN